MNDTSDHTLSLYESTLALRLLHRVISHSDDRENTSASLQ